MRDEREREAGQGLCAAGGAGRRKELAVEVVAEHREAARVVGVLVRDEDVRDAVEVAAARVRAAHELAARDAAVDEDAALRTLDHGGVSLGPAGQYVQVHLGRHVAPGGGGRGARPRLPSSLAL